MIRMLGMLTLEPLLICHVTKNVLMSILRINGTYVYLGDGISLKVQGYGMIYVNMLDGQLKEIHNVLYVLEIKKNLIYVSSVTGQDLKVEFVKSGCVVKDIHDHYRVIARGTKVGGLYKLNVTKITYHALAPATMST